MLLQYPSFGCMHYWHMHTSKLTYLCLQVVRQLYVLTYLQRFEQLLPVMNNKCGAECLMSETEAREEQQLNSAGRFSLSFPSAPLASLSASLSSPFLCCALLSDLMPCHPYISHSAFVLLTAFCKACPGSHCPYSLFCASDCILQSMPRQSLSLFPCLH